MKAMLTVVGAVAALHGLLCGVLFHGDRDKVIDYRSTLRHKARLKPTKARGAARCSPQRHDRQPRVPAGNSPVAGVAAVGRGLAAPHKAGCGCRVSRVAVRKACD